MKRVLFLCAMMMLAASLWAQDSKPGQVRGEEERTLRTRRQQRLQGLHTGDVPFAFTPSALPASFVHRHPNHLLQAEELHAFFDKVAERGSRSVRVVQIGDSHVRGHVFPRALRRRLEEAWGREAMVNDSITYHTSALATETGVPGFVFSALSKNGVTLSYFEDEELLRQIADLRPDLLIISLGTNESHAPKFEVQSYGQQLEQFGRLMAARCPGTQILLTTPPGSYLKQGGRRVRRRRRWVTVGGNREPNPHTAEVVAMQRQVAAQQHWAVWDLYELAGGSSFACENWSRSGLQNKDGVHFTPQAYTLQGRLLAEAILQAWNDYLNE